MEVHKPYTNLNGRLTKALLFMFLYPAAMMIWYISYDVDLTEIHFSLGGNFEKYS